MHPNPTLQRPPGNATTAALRWVAEITYRRGALSSGVFSWERSLPCITWTVVPYLSILGLFAASFAVDREPRLLNVCSGALVASLLLALACCACVPLPFTLEQPIPPRFFGPLFELLRAADLPCNQAPSDAVGRVRMVIHCPW